jgi:hypothetical protein
MRNLEINMLHSLVPGAVSTPTKMFRTLLLTIAVTLAMPAFADTPPNPNDKNVNAAKNTIKGDGQINPIQFGTGKSLNNPVGKGTGKEPVVKSSVSNAHVTPPMPKVKPKVTDPCKSPNPPHSCKRSRPAH